MTRLTLCTIALTLAVALAGCPRKLDGGGGSGAADGGAANVPGAHGDAGHGTAGGGGAGSSAHDAGQLAADAGARHDAGSATVPAGDAGGTGAIDAGSAPACSPACAAYQHCALVQVQCIRAPCPPLPQCIDNPTCGRIAARPCPGSGQCQDDPRDSCDPAKGGADCGGLCVCVDHVLCIKGKVWDSAQCGCVAAPDAGVGVSCGKLSCAKSQVCCNASCGICTDPSGACTQQLCQ
jgi:hypothetical protein